MGEINQPVSPLNKEGKKLNQLTHFSEFSSGAGSTQIKQDKKGFFIGGTNFENSPWSVDYQGNQYIGANGEITLDGPNKKVIVGANNEVVIDGTAKTITTDFLKDKTYGFFGVFAFCATSTSTTGTWTIDICADNGGLMNATLNYTDGSNNYKLLPGFNTATLNSYYYLYKSGGRYKAQINRGTITGDVSYNKLFFTAFFNSAETNGW